MPNQLLTLQRNVFSKAALAALLVTIVGCKVGPDYQRPPIELPAEFRQNLSHQPTMSTPEEVDAQLDQLAEQSANQTADERSLAFTDWNAIYHDKYLVGYIESALTSNLDLAITRSRYNQATLNAKQVGASLWPVFGVKLTGDREYEVDNANNEFELLGLMDWEIDLFGYNRRLKESAVADALSAEFAIYAQQVSLIGTVATTYFELLDSINQIGITQATVATRSETLRILRLRKDNGMISGLDVKQAEVALAQAEAKLPSLLSLRLQKENSLRLLTGLPPGPIETKFDNETNLEDYFAVPSNLPVALPSTLIQRRPDILIALADLESATAQTGVATADLFPRLTLSAEFGSLTPEFSDLIGGDSKYWDAFGSVTQPLFESGRRNAAVDSAKQAQRQALLSYRQTLLSAFVEVSNALDAYKQSEAITQSNTKLLQAAKGYLNLAMLQYREGALGYIDVLDAQRQLFNAETSLSQAKRDRLIALSTLYRALGGGWKKQSGET